MVYHQLGRLPKAEKGGMTPARVRASRRTKRSLVEHGSSHGILVYADGEPVGWCQYGPKEELPRVDAATLYRRMAPGDGRRRLWRITCFWVDRPHRHRGVAKRALGAALEAIRTAGGGLVEGFPARTKGFPADWTGTLSMFRREGFHVVAPYGKYNFLVRREV